MRGTARRRRGIAAVKVIFVLFDSLNRHSLACYGGSAVKTPNFHRLAQRCVTFDNHYVGSLPCMPARRDMHTGRLQLPAPVVGPARAVRRLVRGDPAPEGRLHAPRHRPLPLLGGRRRDLPQALRHVGIRARPGGRPVEGDGRAAVGAPARAVPPLQFSSQRRHKSRRYIINREFIREGSRLSVGALLRPRPRVPRPQPRRRRTGCCRSRRFDPHEPFHAPDRFRGATRRATAARSSTGRRYARVDEPPEECEELRANYYAVVALCDHDLGQVLDDMDRHGCGTTRR